MKIFDKELYNSCFSGISDICDIDTTIPLLKKFTISIPSKRIQDFLIDEDTIINAIRGKIEDHIYKLIINQIYSHQIEILEIKPRQPQQTNNTIILPTNKYSEFFNYIKKNNYKFTILNSEMSSNILDTNDFFTKKEKDKRNLIYEIGYFSGIKCYNNLLEKDTNIVIVGKNSCIKFNYAIDKIYDSNNSEIIFEFSYNIISDMKSFQKLIIVEDKPLYIQKIRSEKLDNILS